MIFFVLFILVRGPGRVQHASMTAETLVQSVLPNNTLVKELTLTQWKEVEITYHGRGISDSITV
jgi:hypothetical protein